jgi:SnoaL-like protein
MRRFALASCAAFTLTSVVAAHGDGHFQSAPSTAEAPVKLVLDDYIGLYRKETLERWKTLFLPAFTATYTDEDGGVTTRTLEDFYERQRAAFERGPVNETLDNVRITRAGRLAQAFADFHFTSGGSARHGQLMLALIEEKGQFRIAALTFTYHLQ